MSPALLQVALDLLDPPGAARLTRQLAGVVDVFEAGTPMIKRYGMEAVRQVREAAGEALVVADTKTMDAGGLEAEMAVEAGADLLTVLGCASDTTVSAACEVAHAAGKRVIVDLIGVADKPARARQLGALGVDILGIHAGTDEQRSGADPLADLAAVTAVTELPVAVAGGVTLERLPALLSHGPSIVIVGSAITGVADPVVAARAFEAALAEWPAGAR